MDSTCVLISAARAAKKLRLVEQACNCFTVRGGGGRYLVMDGLWEALETADTIMLGDLGGGAGRVQSLLYLSSCERERERERMRTQ